MGHALHHLLKGDVPVSVLRKQDLVRLIRKAADAVVHTRGILRVGIQPVHLKLQLFRVVPVVVPLTDGDILAPAGREKHHVIEVNTPGVEILCLIEGPDDLRVSGCVFPDDVPGAVGGGIVVYQHLKGKIRLLIHETVQGLAQILLMVVCGAEDRDLASYLLFHRKIRLLSVIPPTLPMGLISA